MSAASPPSLESLPDEVLRQILSYISPRAILVNVQRLSKRYNTLGNEPLLWRHHCRVDYKHWDSKHRIKHKFLGQAQHVDWKALYLHRRNVDTQTTELLDSILEGQTSRLKKFDLICGYGYDAKEILLRHCAASDNAEDVLARR
jgi:F-box protein 21